MAKLPKSDNRTVIIGSTGSGKTVFGSWLLSTRDFDQRPWIVIDYKGDELLDDIGAQIIPVGTLPKEPGLYIMRPIAGDPIHEQKISQFFAKAWERENIGIYIDEGYMIPKNDRWFRACLTQGRSKHIEIIICSQRPVFLDKFVFTEANFFAIFNMNYKEDRKHMMAYLDGDKLTILPRFHSLWYDVGGQRSTRFSPVPPSKEIVGTFQKRLENRPTKL